MDIVRIEDGRGMLIRVTGGSIWVTEEGDARDRIVPAGRRFRIGSSGVTLISALGRGTITLGSRPRRSLRLRARLMRWWKGMFVAGARPTTAAL